MSRFDRRRRGARGATTTGVAVVLFALVAGAEESIAADERSGGVPPVATQAIETPPVDGLGASRLFFTAEERHAMTLGEPGLPRQPSGSTGETRDEAPETDAVSGPRAAGPVRMTKSNGAAEADRAGRVRSSGSASSGIAFQALLHADGRAQVVLGGRLCRAEPGAEGRAESGAEPLVLRCATMPAGVRAVKLLRQEKRLLVTLSDGGLRHLALGESVALP